MTPEYVTPENRALIADLVEWVAVRPRTYAEAMDAWRTSCPRLTIWEDAVEQGLVACARAAGSGPGSGPGSVSIVRATPEGLELLRRAGRLPPASRRSSAA